MNVTPRIIGDDFDSSLQIPSPFSAANCTLTINLKVFLHPYSGVTYQRRGQTYKTRAWRNAEWSEFVFLYKHISNHYWNNRFWLTPPASFAELDLPLDRPTHRPNVFCRLNLEIAKTRGESHVEIEVVHLDNDEPKPFRSHSRLYDDKDVQVKSNGKYLQIPVVHEVAHLLGIDHPGLAAGRPACLRNGNLKACYGKDGYERDQISGSGMAFRVQHAEPWRDRMSLHTDTNAGDWRVSMMRVEPQALARAAALRP